MRRAATVPVLVLLLAVAGCAPAAPSRPGSGSTQVGTPSTPPITAAPQPAGWVGEMLAAVNARRASAGVAPLQLCGTLATAAQRHSEDQAATSTMSHTGSDGSTMVVRVERAGYRGWTALAENVAAGYPTVSAVVTGWMGSSGHRANLLSASYVHVGFGRATSSSGTPYWTQNFGRSGTC